MGTAEGPGSVLDVLGDPKTRQILVTLNVGRSSVSEIAEICDMSEPTAYRRVSNLEEQDLVEKVAMISPEGVHYNEYKSRFSSAMVRIEDDQFQVNVIHDSAYGGSLAELWAEVRRSVD